MFVRFVAGADPESAYWLTGVITSARILRDDGVLYRHEVHLLAEAFEWFDHHLPCPPFREKLQAGAWTREAVCWFRDDAREALGRIWDIVFILEEHGVPVRLVTTNKPGKIVYSDEFQVVAETPYWA